MISKAAIAQSRTYNSAHRIGEDEPLVAGFRDPGRSVRIGEDGGLVDPPGREIIVVSPISEDPTIARVLEEARVLVAGCTSDIDRVELLADYVARTLKENNPAKNEELLSAICRSGNLAGSEVSVGELIDAGTGVCRHRSILFKLIADYIGVRAALVRGIYVPRGADHREDSTNELGGHAWNEVVLDNGLRIVVDVMHNAILDLGDEYLESYSDCEGTYLYREKRRDFAGEAPALAAHQDQLVELGLLRSTPWVEAQSPTGGKSVYAYLDEMPPTTAAALRGALDKLGLRHDDYLTSLGAAKDRRLVLRVRGASLLKLRWLGVRAKSKQQAAAAPAA